MGLAKTAMYAIGTISALVATYNIGNIMGKRSAVNELTRAQNYGQGFNNYGQGFSYGASVPLGYGQGQYLSTYM